MGRPLAFQPAAPADAPAHPALAMLAAETRIRRGEAPLSVGGVAVAPGTWCLGREEFLLRAGEAITFYYRRGAGVLVDAPDDSDPRDIRLWREGTVHAAIAALNGLVPLHASAVAHDGQVYAFTGPAGAGKSTLVAALGKAGFAQFSDDTLILDPSALGAPLCLPGHKRTKLWPEGARLAGVEPGEQVASDYAKHVVEPAAGTAPGPLPLAALIELAVEDEPRFAPLGLGERIALLEGDHYTAQLWRAAAAQPRDLRFAELAALAGRIPMARFWRPFEASRFDAGVAAAARYIRGER